jgi:HNH endonuclease
MPKDRQHVGLHPKYISCDSPLSRNFPEGWKDIMFRLSGKKDVGQGAFYYTCPICGTKFDFSSIDHLQGDHIWPYSLFGDTKWENYQLICGKCNAAKGNRLDVDVRRVLGSGAFRLLVAAFLEEKIQTGELTKDAVIKSILGSSQNPPERAR